MTARRRRVLFTLAILVGSFLLFLVQPMVARMALPRLGGAPNVWNSAMLVYQALLLAGYAYAHAIGRFALRRQAAVHLGLLVLAGLTLPIALSDLAPAAAGMEVLWVPALFLATIGPVFFAMSAQAPLMQRWYAADSDAGDPYPLYAASNLGSFGGLIAYPLLVEPLVPLHWQSIGWSAGYAVLVVLVVVLTRFLPSARDARVDECPEIERLGWRRILLWLALAAVPSGLMLSTTTYLTTDIMAMPLLWVIPLGLYLLSFSVAFAAHRRLANLVSRYAAALVITLGAVAVMLSADASMAATLVSVALLFVIAVALHARLFDARPEASRLTLFYLVMSLGGAIGGALTALVAPILFDWTWEHPLLIVSAALLVPMPGYARWMEARDWTASQIRLSGAALLGGALIAVALLAMAMARDEPQQFVVQALLAVVVVLAILIVRWRPAFAALTALAMLAVGLTESVRLSVEGARTRSYFGIYTVEDVDDAVRTLAHGTTLHGVQMRDPDLRRVPTTYYGHTSGVGLALVEGNNGLPAAARIGVVGLGVGTLACYRRPGQAWTFFEIDPAVLDYSRDGTFTFLRDCAPDARVVLGDARIELARALAGGFDIIAIDAFSSDAIPLHLLTDEAIETYLRALAPDGVLLVHISNRYVDLKPALSALARDNGLAALLRVDRDVKPPRTGSYWVALARDPQRLAVLREGSQVGWRPLPATDQAVWTDDFASILPHVTWSKFL